MTASPDTDPAPDVLASIDLGSNSFRLEIGVARHGQVQRLEYLKEIVRQGNGLDANRNLTPEAMERGWACLARFGDRLRGFAPQQVRAVATQTLREARNRDVFLAKGSDLLGFPIDVIAGREEARLIYIGVAHSLPQSPERRLVIDVGGRSTEVIAGTGYAARLLESYRVGSVAWSMKFFGKGDTHADAFDRAVVAAQAVLDEAASLYAHEWDAAYGASGTVGAVADILVANGHPADRISHEGLLWLRERLVRAGHVDRVRLDGLRDDRRAVIAGGLSVLLGLFDLLGITEMVAADGGLRHGVLQELLQRQTSPADDVRSATVQRLALTFGADAAQGERVAQLAQSLLHQLHQAQPAADLPRAVRKLRWAAQLHEIGAAISHEDAHKHGAYILDHCDAPGFAQHELHRLSQLVLGHRGKLRKLDTDWSDPEFVRQLLCLRLAVLVCHARRDPAAAPLVLTAEASAQSYTLRTTAEWAQAHPQSMHLLQQEVDSWAKTPWTLTVSV
jgi:exopolyphosphatase / guanosine-5'-triphosphate,3'-diphosphate pyrophosphatase